LCIRTSPHRKVQGATSRAGGATLPAAAALADYAKRGAMGVKVDLRVLELLASRVCHDLISPIGAVGNGLELLEDADDEMSADALKLSVNCVRRASALLEFFRMASGP